MGMTPGRERWVMGMKEWVVAPAPDRVLLVQDLLEQLELARMAGDLQLVASLQAEYRLLRGEL